ncbi:cellulose biosynthesis cyclic di-GMP-binding regulatory protein BcsB [Listeria seeligeri]|uniref:cellulose biosynthesis cyclic di-GMP-binding regulatory protein BcsB n=1 Tax=Listeria seeligeri TaxID=1640 RepID=UPI00162A7A33|nr:cellulose biosynthesis cyclic di-GMP-binding regulatory protein BcsB [Listeria seeligeri]MBC1421507.1 cellulose biosynthesis cyclic di-GMP-binding regulatory protein BcsB [Listeria seeligeri]MBC1751009.1 cellulose biosynthesis cyclic di-GMP-binding regulatory protein BcsB [Listeria seeligeri]MBC1843631.1 cellulose biosynthesis cyclic di-GMP-binding regulatory protein BcsB [Listeria seeligeri]MBC2232897.1 cellulose biosynthesis cyclic di-GMP-binding regulatory protein BcsB [Listeria seeligeri
MKKLTVMGLLVFAILFLYRPDVFAADKTYQTVFGTDKTAQGKFTTTKQNFTIENYWDVSSAKAKLVYTITQLNEKEISTMTLKINDVAFYSFRPDKTDKGTRQMEVEIPKDKLKKGVNVLSVESFVYTDLPDGRCTIDDTPANWLQFDKTSAVNVTYSDKAFKQTIADFGERFTGIDTVKSQQGAVAVLENAGDTELGAALEGLSGFSSANTLEDKNIPFGKYEEAKTRDGKNYIALFSSYDNLPTAIKSQIKADKKLETQALFQVVTMGNTNTLVVTSKSNDALKKAGKLIANQNYLSQLGTNSKWLTTDEKIDTPANNVDKNTKLTTSGDKIKGIGHVTQDYFISMPANRSASTGTEVSLDFRYAQNLDFEHSLVTILVNGKPIGSQKLSAKKANGDKVTFQIPSDLNVKGDFSVTVAFDLVLTNNYCGFISDSEIPWAYITPESTINLNTTEETDLLFEQYPYPFVADGDFNNAMVVVPDKLTTEDTDSLANIFNLLGRFHDGNRGSLTAVHAKNWDKAKKDANVIAVGTMNNNPVIKNANDDLYFQYDKTGSYFLSNEKISIENNYGKGLGSVQLIKSEGMQILAVTGPGTTQTELGSELIASKANLAEIYGDGAIVDNDNTIHSYRFKKAADTQDESFGTKISNNKEVTVFGAFALLTVVLLGVAVLLILRKYRRK